VCVIGAGAAGLTIAYRMERAGIPCVVLEAGGARPSRQSQAFYWTQRSGVPTHSFAYSRFRALGGSTTFWTGQCAELEEEDFLGRGDTVPAWPFEKAALANYYREASDLLGLRPPGQALQEIAPDTALASETTAFREVRLSPLRSFAKGSFMKPPGHGTARVILNAPVTDIRADTGLGHIRAVDLRLPGGRRVTCEADHFVLAGGGVENARLLLASNSQAPRGLGNAHDLVGRYFMDHAYMFAGTLTGATESLRRISIGSMAAQRDRYGGFPVLRSRGPNSNAAALFLTEPPAFGLSERLSSAQGRALTHLSQILRGERYAGRDTAPHLEALLRQPDRMLALVAGRVASLVQPRPMLAIRLFAETTPQYDSRIRLMPERDSLGLPRAAVEWNVSEEDKRGPAGLLDALKRALSTRDAGLKLETDIAPGQPWPGSFTGGKHHVGTTRMGDTARSGVVDANCRVHGLANLYVSGSSVFPSSGWANPTLTIVALALRLSDELRRAATR
jgi:choline dehydrogenase-like flavoprotein